MDYTFRENFGFNEGGDGIYGISVPLSGKNVPQGARLRLAYDEAPVNEAVFRIHRWIFYAGMIHLMILIPVSLLASSLLTKPLGLLGQSARRVAAGDLNRALAVHSGISELEALRNDMDDMRSQLKRRGDDIVEREARLGSVIENTAEGILTLDRTGKIESINAAALAIFGYSINSISGMPFLQLLREAEADRFLDSDGRPLVGQGQSYTGVKENGHTLPILISVNTFKVARERLYSVVVQDISERVMFEEKLSRMAYYDAMTGLPNRRLFHDRLNQAVYRAKRHNELVGLLFLDLDRFKQINDSLGHLYGDLLIQGAAKRLMAVVRQDDTVARLGGDEFTIILSDIINADNAAHVSQKIIDEFSKPFQLREHEVTISVSIGIALFPLDSTDVDTLIKDADMAMYQAKEGGRNIYEFFSAQLHEEANEKHLLEISLRKAVNEKALEVNFQPQVMVDYQPKIDCFSSDIVGAEALVRWHHPERGLIFPDQFIPLAEETGLIIPIGEWVLRAACLQQLAWKKAGHPSMRVSVNLSACQLQNPDIVSQVRRVVEETGVDPSCLELELTERMILHNLEEVAAHLREFKAMGILISIDDFGTGHSSLSNIQMLPIDEIKIDKSFIDNVSRDTQKSAITEAIIGMAHKLGLRVVAEGVEREEDLRYLHAQKCDLMQGYYFSRPVCATQFDALFTKGHLENVN